MGPDEGLHGAGAGCAPLVAAASESRSRGEGSVRAGRRALGGSSLEACGQCLVARH